MQKREEASRPDTNSLASGSGNNPEQTAASFG